LVNKDDLGLHAPLLRHLQNGEYSSLNSANISGYILKGRSSLEELYEGVPDTISAFDNQQLGQVASARVSGIKDKIDRLSVCRTTAMNNGSS